MPPERDLTLPGDIWQPPFWLVPVLRDRQRLGDHEIAGVAEAYYVPRSPYVAPAGPLELISAAT